MKSKTRLIVVLALLTIMSVPILVPSYVFAWKAEDSGNFDWNDVDFNTHQWLAWEAVKLFPESKMSWITNNLEAFWLGVEAPFHDDAAEELGLNASDYGKVNYDDCILYLDETASSVTNDTLAVYAETESDKLVAELEKDDIDYELAAFYAGAMSHYVSQAGVYGTIWNETLWGPLNKTNWATFEDIVESGISESEFDPPAFNYNFQDMSVYFHQRFSLSPSIVAPLEAYDASVDLAVNTHGYAKSMQNNLNISAANADQWTAAYKNNVTDCLTFSVEAIYASLEYAMNSADWSYITLPDPVFNYDNVTHHIEIPEFTATFTNETGTYILNETIATTAEVYYVYYDDDDPNSLSSDSFDLSYNSITGKWFYTDQLAQFCVANTNHSLLYYFDMDRASPTWSNESTDLFYASFYNATINSLEYNYNRDQRILNVYNVTLTCWDIPEIGDVTPSEVSSITWHLYQKGEGSLIADAAGIQVIDTEGNRVEGDLLWNGENYSSYDNDIGLVFSAANTELYVLVRARLIVPVGYIREAEQGGEDIFTPYLQRNGRDTFRAKDHQITISKPELVVYTEETENETKTFISAYGITAISDYNNTVLDYYEIVEKTVHGSDRREARWKVFLWDGIPARLTGLLNWNETGQFWYVEGIEVGFLPDNQYYISAKIVNQNTNFTTSPWGPASDIFEISRPLPVVYYILPEFFLAGFIVLFGWLAWYRPRQKRLKIEAEREARLEKIYD
jgi:hypothetical protein